MKTVLRVTIDKYTGEASERKETIAEIRIERVAEANKETCYIVTFTPVEGNEREAMYTTKASGLLDIIELSMQKLKSSKK